MNEQAQPGTNEEIITQTDTAPGETDAATLEGDKATESNKGLGLGNNSEEVKDLQGLGDEPESEEEKFAKEYMGKPENGYDYKDVEMPEGIELNKDITEKFNGIAGKYNMNQKGADEIMALGGEIALNVKDNVVKAIARQAEEQSAKFYEALKSDSELGGNKLEESLKMANLSYLEFIQKDQEVHNLFVQTGLINHPTVVKAFYEFGKQMQDGGIQYGSPAGKQRTASDWYPNMPKGKS